MSIKQFGYQVAMNSPVDYNLTSPLKNFHTRGICYWVLFVCVCDTVCHRVCVRATAWLLR
jgi:hypothetical protein